MTILEQILAGLQQKFTGVDTAVSEHFRECFNRHVVRQAYGRRVGVAAHVEQNPQSSR